MKLLKQDCRIEFFTGTGKGGQHRNRHYNCVRIHHIPTGLIATATEQRSQAMNLAAALERIQEKLRIRYYKKPKRIPTKTSRSAKERTLNYKKKLSDKKKLRRRADLYE